MDQREKKHKKKFVFLLVCENKIPKKIAKQSQEEEEEDSHKIFKNYYFGALKSENEIIFCQLIHL